ncbi:MAG: hypothetical protein ACYTGB_03920 [Planctomycetota bacterium]
MPDRRPTWTEALLLVLLGIAVAALILTRGDGIGHREALAGGGGAAGIIAIAGNGERADLFYVVDTARQRICVYRWSNPGLRLVAARAYDFDMEVQDSSGDKTIEGRGATRHYVKAQVEAQRRKKELKPLNAK